MTNACGMRHCDRPALPGKGYCCAAHGFLCGRSGKSTTAARWAEFEHPPCAAPKCRRQVVRREREAWSRYAGRETCSVACAIALRAARTQRVGKLRGHYKPRTPRLPSDELPRAATWLLLPSARQLAAIRELGPAHAHLVASEWRHLLTGDGA